MSSYQERRKKRYAEDPEFRAKTLAYNRAWHQANRERVNAGNRRRWRENPVLTQKQRDYRRKTQRRDQLKYYYGMSVEDFDALLALQDGACAICKRTCDENLCVDHCHVTGKVRGLLCRTCNFGLGLFKDDPRFTRAATEYLEAFAARNS